MQKSIDWPLRHPAQALELAQHARRQRHRPHRHAPHPFQPGHPQPGVPRQRMPRPVLLAALVLAAGTLLGLLASAATAAEDASTAPAAPSVTEPAPLSFNVSIVSDYRYRGISQTRLKPALQGGADYVLPSGLYVGAWGSTIQWIKDNGVRGPVELDVYGGYRGQVREGLGYDLGLLHYAYLGNKLADTGGGGVYKNANTTELYGAATIGPFTAKLSTALGNLFGYYDFAGGRNTRGSSYAELNASFDVGGGFTLAPHVGYQKVRHLNAASYADYALTLGKDLGSGLSLGAGVVGSNADKAFYVPGAAANSGKFLGKTALVVNAKFAF